MSIEVLIPQLSNYVLGVVGIAANEAILITPAT